VKKSFFLHQKKRLNYLKLFKIIFKKNIIHKISRERENMKRCPSSFSLLTEESLFESSPSASVEKKDENSNLLPTASSPTTTTLSSVDSSSDQKNSTNPKKPRCHHCHKKSILQMQCSYCHFHFCVSDRLPEVHQCEAINLCQKNDLKLSKISFSKFEKI
jgi:hypothetical protein